MAIHKSIAVVQDGDGRVLGEGNAVIHLARGPGVQQRVTGTVSLRRWQPDDRRPEVLVLQNGEKLDIAVSTEKLSDCSRNNILRFDAVWPPSEQVK